MRISIALATYDGARYLPEQLASLARQTLLPHELVVGDDGSTDGTLAILEEFARDAPFPVRVHRNGRRLRVGDNFLAAGLRCEGEAIAWCDQDDVWLEGKLERCAEGLEAGHVAVVHATELVDDELRPLGRRYPEIGRTQVVAPLAGDLRFMAQGCSQAFRAPLLRLVDPARRPRLLSAQYPQVSHDAWTYLLANATGSILLLAEPLGLYRQHGGNAVGAKRNDVRTRVRTALPVGEATYRRDAVTWGDWAGLLEELAAGSTESALRERYAAGAARYRRLARNYERRASAYEAAAPRRRRLARLAALAVGGGYGDRLRGGLGSWSLLKDVVATLAPMAADDGRVSELVEGLDPSREGL